MGPIAAALIQEGVGPLVGRPVNPPVWSTICRFTALETTLDRRLVRHLSTHHRIPALATEAQHTLGGRMNDSHRSESYQVSIRRNGEVHGQEGFVA